MRFKPLIRKLMKCGTRITVFIHLSFYYYYYQSSLVFKDEHVTWQAR